MTWSLNRNSWLMLLSALLLAFLSAVSHAQGTVPPNVGGQTKIPGANNQTPGSIATGSKEKPLKTPEAVDHGSDGSSARTDDEILNARLVLGFGIVVFILSLLAVHLAPEEVNPARLLPTVLILVGVMFIIAGNYGKDASAPAYGIFGTLAGYILGQSTVRNNNNGTGGGGAGTGTS